MLSDESANTRTEAGCWSLLVDTNLGFSRQKRSTRNALIRKEIRTSRRPRDSRLLSGAKTNTRQANAITNNVTPNQPPVGLNWTEVVVNKPHCVMVNAPSRNQSLRGGEEACFHLYFLLAELVEV